ncbi:MAG: hypothetical protein U0R52_12180 [Solirubrobacterales bacterium]
MELRRRRRAVLAAAAAAALAALLALAAPPAASAGKYGVVQCGWRVGSEAEFSTNAAPGKFRPDSLCVPPAGGDPFELAHLKSFAVPAGGTVSGGRLALWRWTAPPGTAMVNVRGSWWHALHDGFRHRLGTAAAGFEPFAEADSTATAPSAFAAGFDPPRRTFESRLLCARPEDRHCALDPSSFSAVRALTLTLSDPSDPRPSLGGPLLSGGWHRGTGELDLGAADTGSGLSGLRIEMDGAPAIERQVRCSQMQVGGERRATRMAPCPGRQRSPATVDTASLRDGAHSLRACAEDFSGNSACTAARQALTDNTAPAAPRGLGVVGGEGWRARNGFAVRWVNPQQAPGAPIAGAGYRVAGPGTRPSASARASGDGIDSLSGIEVPRPGAFELSVWLRDAAGNEDPAAAATVPLLFDDVAPRIRIVSPRARGGRIEARLSDADSGLASGRIMLRTAGAGHRAGRAAGAGHRADRTAGAGRWTELPTAPVARGARRAELVARLDFSGLRPGRYRLRAEAGDLAGNRSASGRTEDGRPAILLVPLLRPGVSFRASPPRLRNGEAVRLSGRVAVPGGPSRGGKLVVIQYLESSSGSWRSVLLTRTRPGGGYRATYRFRYVTGLARIRMRALLPTERGWPYARTASRPRTLTVRG